MNNVILDKHKDKLVYIGLVDDITEVYKIKNIANLNGKNIYYIVQKNSSICQ